MSYVGELSIGYSIFLDADAEFTQLVGSRCPMCGDVRFPARNLCPTDLAECQPHSIRGTGVIYEVVLVELAPLGFTAPYRAGYIDLDDGVRIFAQVATDGGRDPSSGDRVTLSVGVVRVDDGEPVLGPIFHGVADAGI